MHGNWRSSGAALIIVLTVAALGLLASASSHAVARGRCDAHRRGAVRVTASVIVSDKGTRKQDGFINRVYDYFACLRPNGAPRYVGDDAPSTDSEYGSNIQLFPAALRGSPVGPDGNLWFTAKNAIGRLVIARLGG